MGLGKRLSLGGLGLLVAVAPLALAESTHVTEAVAHAQAAVAQGKQGYPDALVTQAQEALKHAELAKKETASPHLEQGIRGLKEAIDHGKAGRADAATKAVEDALAHLSEPAPAMAAPSSGDGY
ncbi:MAG: small metal-binding protein SmbP [Nitrospiraceae bacterium]